MTAVLKMKVYLTTIADNPPYPTPLPHFRSLAQRDRVGEHQSTDDAEAADIILFLDAHQHPHDWSLKALRAHPLMKRFPQKSLVYDERDRTWCALPGLYTSMPRAHFDARRQRACSYHALLQQYDTMLPTSDVDLLFSFLGAKSHRVRARLAKISHPRAVLQLSQVNFFAGESSDEHKKRIAIQKHLFTELMHRSRFILCPRGQGSSSIRLFETLSAGRVPVIISNQWEAPRGPDWDSFSLRVREQDIATIPRLLEEREGDFEAMAKRARHAYDEWFAPEVRFHHFTEMCGELLQNGATRQPKRPLLFDKQFLACGAAAQQIKARAAVGTARNTLRHLLRRGTSSSK